MTGKPDPRRCQTGPIGSSKIGDSGDRLAKSANQNNESKQGLTRAPDTYPMRLVEGDVDEGGRNGGKTNRDTNLDMGADTGQSSKLLPNSISRVCQHREA